MDDEELKKSEEILKNVLGIKKYQDLTAFTFGILEKSLGNKYNLIEKIIVGNVINEFIIQIGYFLYEGKTLVDFDKMCNPTYKVFIHFVSIKEFYLTYKEYIDMVKEFYTTKEK